MINVKLEIPLRCYSETEYTESVSRIKKLLESKTFAYNFSDQKIMLRASVEHGKQFFNSDQSFWREAYQEYLTLHPENEAVQQKLVEVKDKEVTRWDIIVSLTGEIEGSLFGYKCYYAPPGVEIPSLERLVEEDLCFPFSHVDRILIPRFQLFAKSFVIAMLLSDIKASHGFTGMYSLYLDNNKIEECRLFKSIPSDYSIIPSTTVEIEDCWSWIITYTKIGNDNIKTPVYFTALNYLLDHFDYETLLFAVLGLESLFVKPKSKNISSQFERNIAAVFSSVNEADLKKIYKLRSRFVHAELEFSFLESFIDFEYNGQELDEAIELATTLLLESIRLLIIHHASRFMFSETINYSFQA